MFETTGERAMYRAKEAAEAVLRDKRSSDKKELLKGTMNANGKYKKFVSFLKLLKASLPINFELSNATIKKLFYDTKGLPFDPGKFKFEETDLGHSGSVRVYLLESKTAAPSMAIKVFRPANIELPAPEKAVYLKKERDEIARLYASVPDLVPKEHYIVMEDPFEKGRPAATVVEEFIAGEMTDVFYLSPQTLRHMAEGNPNFKNQLVKFIEVTLQHEAEKHEVVDILGPKNLIVITAKDGSLQLVLLDPHGYLKTKDSDDADRAERARKRLDFLRQVLELIKG
jgi:hypothetical protein